MLGSLIPTTPAAIARRGTEAEAIMADIDDATRTELEAAVFRRLDRKSVV